MKSIIESSIYLIIMSIICILSLDFIFINKSICKGQELQQYVRDTILIYAESTDSHNIDNNTAQQITSLSRQYNSTINIQYFDTVYNRDYYNITILYPVRSGIFHLEKICTYQSIVAINSDPTRIH